MITTYRILSYILLFFAIFLSIGSVMMMGFALSNPAILFSLFIMAGVVLYTFSSYQFLRKGIYQGQVMKKAKKDFIKVNAYVAAFFAVINFMQAMTAMLDPMLFNDMFKQVGQIQQQGGSIPSIQLFSLIKIILWILLIYAIILGIHIIISFQFLKKYAELFSGTDNESQL